MTIATDGSGNSSHGHDDDSSVISIPRIRATAAIGALAMAASVSPVLAHAAPPLPDSCGSANVVDDICTARLTSVTADVVNGTITGKPVDSDTPITLAGQGDAYLKSTGFGTAAPEAAQSWDTAIDQVADLDVDPANPNWYGNAKARVFLPRTLNDLATRFPPGSLVVRFAADDTQSGSYRLVSIQPTAR